MEPSKDKILLALTSAKDLVPYDFPLTLRTILLEGCTHSEIIQGEDRTQYPVSKGIVQFDAIPGSGEIRIHCS